MALLAYVKKVYAAWIDYPLQDGTLLQAQYRILRFLGMGSYGLTYLCQDIRTGAELVIKQAKPSKGKLGRDLLQKEIEIMQQLQHPSIPRCLAFFKENKQMFMLMDYVKGQTVEDLIFERGAKFSEKEAISLIRKLMPVVSYLHTQGFVHRDIRIPNVILQGDCIYLIDFGLASRIGEPIEYVEGEALQRRRATEVTSDQYAIGHFLLFMLYSTFETTDVLEESAKGWEEELDLSPATKRMIRKLLQIDPAYTSTQAFIDEVNTILEQL
ncbi:MULTISPECIES: serine/threonine protein kinase [Paenibacillus]|uniref:Protein kinase n=1 Tax=Paenibacillus violae TaxID=3077234 RepID=A0ABU3R8D7_9BACL|nr:MULTISPECIES: protein kinase [Paenibacillus]MDU0200519.1 protein kinase [Paenibacillus sp. PFR10]MEC0264585.1 protein kinase [Paenibacillus anseongense]